MTDIGTAVSLLVAITDLAVVKSIRKAIKANLIAEGGIEGPLGNIEMPKPLGTRTRESEPEDGYHSTVRPEQQLTATSMPVPIVRIDRVVQYVRDVPPVDAIETMPEEPHRHRENGPLVPPWLMPLPEPSRSRPVIKCPPRPADVFNKGSMLDLLT